MTIAAYGKHTERAVQAILKSKPIEERLKPVSKPVSRIDYATQLRNEQNRAKREAFDEQMVKNLAEYMERKLNAQKRAIDKKFLEQEKVFDETNKLIKDKIYELARIRLAEIELEIKNARKKAKAQGAFDVILRYASKKYDIPIGAIKGQSRNSEAVMARQCVMYWARRLTNKSFPEIGRLLGGRDHTTVLHGARCYPRKMEQRGIRLREVV